MDLTNDKKIIKIYNRFINESGKFKFVNVGKEKIFFNEGLSRLNILQVKNINKNQMIRIEIKDSKALP